MSDLTPQTTAQTSLVSNTGPQPVILQIIPNLDSGGAERTVVEVAQAIVAAGGRALVAARPGRLAADIAKAGGTLIPFAADAKNPATIVANGVKLARLIRAHRVTLIHARSRAPAWSALIAARRARVPFVTTYHGAYGERSAIKRLYNSVMVRSDIVIANSNWTGALIRERYQTPDDRIVVIPRGIDPATFDASSIVPERMARLRSQWGIANDAQVVFAPARLSPRKGQPVVIEAMGEVMSQRLSDARPVAVILAGSAQGRTEYEAELDALISAHGLVGVVHRVGHVDDVAAAYAMSDVTLVASIEPEAFGRTSIEAQSSGCPVIASDIGATPETLLPSGRAAPGTETGWVFANAEARDLARVVTAALSLSPPERTAMAARARAHVVQQFTLFNLQCATLGVYDQLLGSDLRARFVAAATS